MSIFLFDKSWTKTEQEIFFPKDIFSWNKLKLDYQIKKMGKFFFKVHLILKKESFYSLVFVWT